MPCAGWQSHHNGGRSNPTQGPPATRQQLPCAPGARYDAILVLFCRSAQIFDGAPEPLECRSVHIISNWVKARRATVLYPFSGSPCSPVYTWAPRGGSCHCFVAGMLVHDQAGLLGALISALTVSEQHEQPTSPTVLIMDGCQTRPCLQACPQSACDATGYNGDLCWSHHCTRDNTSCLTTGWAARRTFPKSHQAGRSAPRHPCFS